MKTYPFLLSLFMSFGLMSFDSEAKTAVDFPYYEFNNSSHFDIRRVETTGDSVIVFADLYSRPDSWVKISSGSYIKGNRSGKILQIDSCDGLELDKEVYPGVSGRIPFVMKFAALSAEDDSFDFIESDMPGAFVVRGISIDMPLSDGTVTCHLEGNVTDSLVGRLIVMEATEDFRTVDHFISIPVDNGRFSYDFHADKDGYYDLIPFNELLDGSWRNGNFFAFDGTVNFNIPSRGEMIEVSSSHPDQMLATEMINMIVPTYALINEKGRTISDDNMFTKEGKELLGKMKSAGPEELLSLRSQLSSGDFYSPEYKAFRTFRDSLEQGLSKKELEFYAAKPSLYALTKVYNALQYSRDDEDRKKRFCELYDNLLVDYRPDYYYHDKIKALRIAEQLKPGNQYIDYNITLDNGEKISLSELAAGKVTLIDLWASWCGPCRKLSMEYIPVYEKYKDDGFNVISIAREQYADDMKRAVEQDGYPWKTYLELNDENNIWMLNGVGNGGGTTFLIDKTGKIIVVHPSAKELDEYIFVLKQMGRL